MSGMKKMKRVKTINLGPKVRPAALLVAATVYFGLDTRFTVGSASQAAALMLGGGP